MDSLANYVRTERLRLGMTQEELAKQAGVTQPVISDIERGQTKLPNADARRGLARALRVRHIDILVEAGEITRAEVPGPQTPPVNLNDPVERLCDLLRRIDLTVDRRQEGLDRILQGFLDQDRADGLVTEYLALEPREVG